jgi:hypothetical protein
MLFSGGGKGAAARPSPAHGAVPIRPGRHAPADVEPAAPKPRTCEEEALQAGDGFSRTAIRLNWVYQCGRTVAIPSPDGRSTARVSQTGERMQLDVSGAIGKLSATFDDGPNSSLAWAPDSKALFVTVNQGGIVGSYSLSIVGELDPFPGLDMWDFTHLVHEAFGHPVRCFDPEHPNVAGIAWRGSSRRLLVAAEILPHSNCDSMGIFKGYVLDPYAGKIVETYDQLEMKRRFRPLLGPRLLNATDECITRPRRCWIPQLHP